MASYVVIRYSLVQAIDFRLLIFSFAFPPFPFPPLVNLNGILVLVYVNSSAPIFLLSFLVPAQPPATSLHKHTGRHGHNCDLSFAWA